MQRSEEREFLAENTHPPTPPLPPRASLECTQKDWVSKRSDRWAGPDPAGPGKELRVLKFKFLDCSKMGEEGGMA